ncbi:replication-relaxation family protein [Clostridium sp. 19966]|uniref:replication-relaxation family protein n=1 Tax=Clostridium sp. 19966 TaxID=2768166 RepID=UPI0028DD5EFC|nr:replication-relaxation family protein [Clostridium sp. 19966]MDT8718250.1 replication-relaxation family protein [Clostridium sp. 19966]
MKIQEPSGVKGKRNQERIAQEDINEEFVIEFPLTQFQKKAIEVIYSMRAVGLRQLAEITGYTLSHVRPQMLQLHLNRFVYRRFPTKDTTEPGSKEAFFLLDEAGAIYVSGAYEIASKEVRWNKRDNLVKYETLNHTLRVSETRAKLEIECRDKKHKIVNCWSDRHLYFNYTFEEKKNYIKPDMYFIYETEDTRYNYFVEVDMGTEAIRGFSKKSNSFDLKVPSYEHFKLSGDYKINFERFPRVLVLTNSTARAKKLLEAVKEKQKTKVEFLFTTFDFWDENCTGKIFLKTDGSYCSMFD